MSLYPVNSCIIQSLSVLYFATKQNALLQHCLVKSKIRYQNTLPKYVTKCNVFCITYSGFFSFCAIVKLGSVARLNFYLLRGDIPRVSN